MNKLQTYLKKWWKQNREKFYIAETSGTWLHIFARIIHALGKFTSLLPNFGKKYKPKPTQLHPHLKEQLQAKFDLYTKEIERHQDAEGFILHEHCDSTLMSGLYSATAEVNLEAARDKDGFWHRRPTDRPCYPKGSGSTFSRDMMLGVCWYLWENKKLELAEATFEHAKTHNFVMGLGDPTRLIMMPSGEATLAEICHRLGGQNRLLARHQSQVWPTNLKGYRVHLLMMHGLLRGRIQGQIDEKLYKAFESYAKQNPKNPLHQYAYSLYEHGDLNKAVEALLDEKYWPADRLPTRKDRENDWITSRDYGSNWEPATDGDVNIEHSGGDFLVVAHLILSSLD